jgi:Zn-dependent peptidase ImmA (M78 family)
VSTSVYVTVRKFANELRSKYDFSGVSIKKSDIRRIYKDEGIRLDYRDEKLRELRGAYFPPPLGPAVMIAKRLPEEPQIFTLAHELKHHFFDQDKVLSFCDISNQDAIVEKSAEVFAAELMFPQEAFREYMEAAGIAAGACAAEDIVHLKMKSQTTLSYAGLCKIASFLGFSGVGALKNVKFRKLQEQLYGEPFYKRLRGSTRRIRAT